LYVNVENQSSNLFAVIENTWYDRQDYIGSDRGS